MAASPITQSDHEPAYWQIASARPQGPGRASCLARVDVLAQAAGFAAERLRAALLRASAAPAEGLKLSTSCRADPLTPSDATKMVDAATRPTARTSGAIALTHPRYHSVAEIFFGAFARGPSGATMP